MAEMQTMKSTPLFISVVLPVYNEEKYISSCLAALQVQDYPAKFYEVIVVDNASTDRTVELAAQFGVRILSESRKGVARARQRGAELARGEIIAGLDADSRPPAHWLATIDRLFRQDPNLGAATGPVFLYDGKFWEKWFAASLSNPAIRLTHILGRGWLQGNNFAVKKSLFFSVGGFNADLPSGEDVDLSLRLQGVARLAFDPQMRMNISSRRAGEGYGYHIRRSVGNYIRVVLLKKPPYSGYVVDVR
ncbi:MAG: glycosyltransferase [Chloroflexi bacterium]|nr:glycosyltransferase [Chloroflexota bacterium]